MGRTGISFKKAKSGSEERTSSGGRKVQVED